MSARLLLPLLLVFLLSTLLPQLHAHSHPSSSSSQSPSPKLRRVGPDYSSHVAAQQKRGLAHLSTLSSTSPQQLMLSVTGNPTEIAVSWVTFAPVSKPVVQWGSEWGYFQSEALAGSINFTDNNPLHYQRFVHNALLQGILPGNTYFYRVGCPITAEWSDQYELVLPTHGDEIVRMAVYGDMGLVNSQSMNLIAEEVEKGDIDLILHLGDFAYDLHTDNGRIGDIWFNELQRLNLTTRVPYIGCAGNHEGKYNMSHYSNRFSSYNFMADNSQSPNNWWFSWEYQSGGATVHMVALNSEVYYIYSDEFVPPDYSLQRKLQYQWLETDLAAARARNVDWIIVYAHRPMYCSNTDDMPDCSTDAELLRVGTNSTAPFPWPTGGTQILGTNYWGLETILGKYNVDMYFAAHEHSYERTAPVYQGQWDQASLQGLDEKGISHVHVDPIYPVHIITGSAGCQELFDFYDDIMHGGWSLVRSATYGFGHLVVHNSTHLYWDQLLDEGRQGLDTMWIVRTTKEKKKPLPVEVAQM